MLDRHDDRGMIVAPARDRDVRASRVGELRPSAPISSGAVSRLSSSATRTPLPSRTTSAALAGIIRVTFSAAIARVAQRRAEQPVLEHDAERIVALGGDRTEPAGLQPVADPDRPDRAALPFQPLADADRLQHPPGGARTRGRAAVILRRQRLLRIGGIDDDAGKAVPVERDGEVRPTRPPPRMIASARSIFRLAMQRRNAKRLTAESARAHCERIKREHLGHG
jgi:hypothetical protein